MMIPQTLACALVVVALTPNASVTTNRSSVTEKPLAKVLAAARHIDRLIESDLAKNRMRPNSRVDDATFVRRAYLDLIGRIPTVKEAREFLAKRDPAKRRKLVDQLLDSRGHESHMFNYWADLLRVKTRLNNQISGEPYIHWLKESIANNKPYNRFVSELLTASGPAHQRGNGATGYYLRDRNMPEDNMSNTVRVFLGTRLECAQCHDHPFDKWKQKDFFGMAAFTGGIGYRDNTVQQTAAGKKLQRLSEDIGLVLGRQAQRGFGRALLPLQQGITGSGAGLARLPHDYKYDDAKPNQPIKAKTMVGDAVEVDVQVPVERRRNTRNRRRPRRMRNNFRGAGTRALYSEWMTSPRNPLFSKVIANRFWKRVFGRGLIEPIDDIKDDMQPSNPELMRYLERLIVDLGYDLRQFQRVLFNTRTYQRQAARAQVPLSEKFYFPGPMLRRLSAEQLWDSVLTLAIPGVDAKLQEPKSPRAEAVYARYEHILSVPEKELIAQAEQYALRVTNPEKYRQMRRKQQQERNKRRLAERKKAMAKRQKMSREINKLRRDLYRAYRKKNKKLIAKLSKELRELGVDPTPPQKRRKPSRRRRGNTSQMVRASDLPSPARPGTFLRQFGQSDREQIEASNTDASVPQVLNLLNGFVERQIIGPQGSEVMGQIDDAKTGAAKIRTAFLAILGRYPKAAESAMWAEDMKANPRETVRDLVWTLLNTHEFRFVQ